MSIRKILIVDDSPTERHVLNDMLTKAGYEVVTSDNGEDAILKAKSLKPDLILMDVVMPGLNGFHFASSELIAIAISLGLWRSELGIDGELLE